MKMVYSCVIELVLTFSFICWVGSLTLCYGHSPCGALCVCVCVSVTPLVGSSSAGSCAAYPGREFLRLLFPALGLSHSGSRHPPGSSCWLPLRHRVPFVNAHLSLFFFYIQHARIHTYNTPSHLTPHHWTTTFVGPPTEYHQYPLIKIRHHI